MMMGVGTDILRIDRAQGGSGQGLADGPDDPRSGAVVSPERIADADETGRLAEHRGEGRLDGVDRHGLEQETLSALSYTSFGRACTGPGDAVPARTVPEHDP